MYSDQVNFDLIAEILRAKFDLYFHKVHPLRISKRYGEWGVCEATPQYTTPHVASRPTI